MNWCRVLLGLLASIFAGAGVIYTIVELVLWPRAYKDNPKLTPRPPVTFTMYVGWVERLLYTWAICIGAWEWVGIWVAVKVAVRWRNSDNPNGKVDNIWPIGTALSVLFGYLGAWIILGKIPMKGINQ